jgi:peptidyl-prolyl cis-trans isomerase A (cyclophilin A)
MARQDEGAALVRRIWHRHGTAWLFLGLLAAVGALGQEAAAPAAAASTQPQQAGEVLPPPHAPATVSVLLHTSLGDIVLALERERAPITSGNFLRYVDQKRLDGSTFYRAMQVGEEGQYGLIQGGLKGDPKRVFKPIAHEPTNVTGLSHVDGAISMARADPGTATADFFIVVGDLVSLDAQPDGGDPGYAVFGRVVAGMDVVRAILEQPRSADAGDGVMKGQMIANPVKIISARRTGE